MGTFKRPGIIIVSTDQIRRHRQTLEILGFRRRRLIGQRERLVGIGPCPPPVGLATPLNYPRHVRGAAARAALVETTHALCSNPPGFDRPAHLAAIPRATTAPTPIRRSSAHGTKSAEHYR
jgi:hypothetical protein